MQSGYFETNHRRMIHFLKLKLMWCRVFKVEVCKKEESAHNDCETEIITEIQMISQLLTLAGLILHALLTALPNVSALANMSGQYGQN